MVKMSERLDKAKKMPNVVKKVADDVTTLLLKTAAFQVVAANHQQLEIQGANADIVNLSSRCCSCGEWQENKVPCIHSVAVATVLKVPLEDFIGEEFRQSTLLKCYSTLLPPIRARNVWNCREFEQPAEPPMEKRGRGRAKTRRTTSYGEPEIKKGRGRYGCRVCKKQCLKTTRVEMKTTRVPPVPPTTRVASGWYWGDNFGLTIIFSP
ncbi:hypothetical protein GEMRC1_003347 [Eukaryota sp. GEM-RC1]